ncbi:dye-decolorizing heme-containing peroxidase [Stygiomarasmius scandens]|uniref:Dye-decolorizing heme-containing peroxidase n=1 Tax=Marasmiellus scandens TaxID=2682957 RepID=A0ABR1JUJ0_9AGAR
MKFSYLSVLLAFAIQSVHAGPQYRSTRQSSILINPDAQPGLPGPRIQSAVPAANHAATLNLNDIQGDILYAYQLAIIHQSSLTNGGRIGMKKKKEMFFFFSIKDAKTFKSKLPSKIAPLITNTNQLLSVDTQPTTAVNIAFSHTGLLALNVTDNLGDSAFTGGQFKDASSIGDPGTSQWVPGFAGTNVHGVFLLASDTVKNVHDELARIKSILGNSISEIHRVHGAARPGDQEGHEHFGFMDGISQPAVQGFTQQVLPGQGDLLPAGEFLVGESGDSTTRPSWAKGGSFLVFRQMQQKVPEFNKYLMDHALNVPGLTQQENVDLLGARFIGRWKSGAPIDLSSLRDDPSLGNDNTRNNNFTFDHPDIPGFDIATNQTFELDAWFAEYKLTTDEPDHHIIRAGIPYGPEVTDYEHTSNASSTDPSLERGLAFVAYQSNINTGFRFLQQAWVNNANFFFGKAILPISTHSASLISLGPFSKIPRPGVDPIIGRSVNAPADTPRNVSGSDPLNSTHIFTLDIDFVVSRGGEYFFSPPISALTGALAV